MRISADEKSPFYNKAGHYVTVELDGVRVKHCREFDTIMGYVICYKEDLEEDAFGNHLTYKRQGKVTITLTGRAEIVGGVLRIGD